MDKALLKRLKDGHPKQKFALCWDIEHWKSGMAGTEDGATFPTYFNESENHGDYLKQYFDHPDYIRIDGKPLLVIYSYAYEQIFREDFRKHINFLKKEYNLYVMETYQDDFVELQKWADGIIEFHANLWHRDTHSRKMAPLISKTSVSRGILTHFDNTPRYPLGFSGKAYHIPEMMDAKRFGANLLWKMCYTRCFDWKDETRLISIFAWNEWGEGAVLEPTEVHGFEMLEAVKEARMKFRKYDCSPNSSTCQKMNETVSRLKTQS